MLLRKWASRGSDPPGTDRGKSLYFHRLRVARRGRKSLKGMVVFPHWLLPFSWVLLMTIPRVSGLPKSAVAEGALPPVGSPGVTSPIPNRGLAPFRGPVKMTEDEFTLVPVSGFLTDAIDFAASQSVGGTSTMGRLFRSTSAVFVYLSRYPQCLT